MKRNEGTARKPSQGKGCTRHASDLRPRGRTGSTRGDARRNAPRRRPRRVAPVASPRKLQVKTGIAPWSRQVFGLVDVTRIARLAYSPPLHGSKKGASACGEGRFHTPLRGSAGISVKAAPDFPFNRISLS